MVRLAAAGGARDESRVARVRDHLARRGAGLPRAPGARTAPARDHRGGRRARHQFRQGHLPVRRRQVPLLIDALHESRPRRDDLSRRAGPVLRRAPGLGAQTNSPASEVVALAQRAEAAGFSHFWTFDSCVLWQEPFVIYSQILSKTSSIIVGPMVTNPVTRDWTVTASLFATLNEMFGPRTICGIGRGDSALRVTGGSPASLATLSACMGVIKELAEGRETIVNDRTVKIPWIDEGHL